MSFLYLGSPYSKYPAGLDAAFEEICRVAGEFARAGIPAYSPIAHTHPITKAAAIDPYDHSIWLPFDKPMMEAARALVIVKMAGWVDSYGLTQERLFFEAECKPVHFFDPKTLLLDGTPL